MYIIVTFNPCTYSPLRHEDLETGRGCQMKVVKLDSNCDGLRSPNSTVTFVTFLPLTLRVWFIDQQKLTSGSLLETQDVSLPPQDLMKASLHFTRILRRRVLTLLGIVHGPLGSYHLRAYGKQGTHLGSTPS